MKHRNSWIGSTSQFRLRKSWQLSIPWKKIKSCSFASSLTMAATLGRICGSQLLKNNSNKTLQQVSSQRSEFSKKFRWNCVNSWIWHFWSFRTLLTWVTSQSLSKLIETLIKNFPKPTQTLLTEKMQFYIVYYVTWNFSKFDPRMCSPTFFRDYLITRWLFFQVSNFSTTKAWTSGQKKVIFLEPLSS